MPFVPPEMASIVARASTLEDRLAGAVIPDISSADQELVAVRLDRWRECAAQNDPQKFARRLALDRLTLGGAQGVLGAVRLAAYPDKQVWPEWAYLLAEAIAAAVEPPDLSAGIDPADPIPFEEVLLPFVVVGRHRA